MDTIAFLLQSETPAQEILVIDQSLEHEPTTEKKLNELMIAGNIRWIRLTEPSITHAMNVGLMQARQDIVLFLDDDIIPSANLVTAHVKAHSRKGVNIVAGQVLQPGEDSILPAHNESEFRFCSNRKQWIKALMGGNFSIKREVGLPLGGFDENFVRVAYRFEAEFADRALAAGERILFEPKASIRHLRVQRGGTRSYGDHLTTIRPGHAVGAYYYLLCSKLARRRLGQILYRPYRAIRTRHHLQKPWWIPVTLVAEFLGFLWAVWLVLRGPQLVSHSKNPDRL